MPYDWTPERVKQAIKVLGGTTRVEFTASGNTTIPAGVTKDGNCAGAGRRRRREYRIID